jgi:hypothetical protein
VRRRDLGPTTRLPIRPGGITFEVLKANQEVPGLAEGHSGYTVPAARDRSREPILAPEDPTVQRSYDLQIPFPDIDSPRPAGGGGVPISMGRVVEKGDSDAGNLYKVLLYPNGPNDDPSPVDPVDVLIAQIDKDEIIPADMWIFNIFQVSRSVNGQTVTEYWGQPPVWIA